MESFVEDLQLEYDLPYDQNLDILQKNMLSRNRRIKVSIDKYAC
jgi:hypothetical protein